MHRIVWSSGALGDLQDLREHIAARNVPAAARMFLTIVDHVELLSRDSRLGRPGRVPGTRELVIPRTPYVVAYAVIGGDTVRILGVRHGARRWPESF